MEERGKIDGWNRILGTGEGQNIAVVQLTCFIEINMEHGFHRAVLYLFQSACNDGWLVNDDKYEQNM